MRSKIILCLKTAWIVAALMTVLVATTICGSSDQACFVTGDTMLLFMGILSFPLGLVFLLLSLLFVDGPGSYLASDYALAWFIMLCGGCCQWFILVPRLFAKPQFTLLDLRTQPNETPKRSVAVAAPASKPSPAAIEAIVSARPSVTSAKKTARSIRPLDRLGRTPLERVINR